MAMNNSVRRAPNAAAQRLSRPVLNIYIGTKAALAGLWIAKYELPFLNRADQERVGSLYLDLEPLSEDIDRVHREVSDSPMIKTTLRFPDLSQYVEGLTQEQRSWLQISNPYGTRIPEYTRMGAGGIRQNGHGAIWYNSPIIAQHLEALIHNISAVDSAGHAPDADLITINIVCFLGGGTGSGALPAISALARHVLRAQRRAGNIFIFAMMPVNVGNVAPERQILQKSNSLAALLELEALMLKGDDKSQAFLFEMGNLQIRVPSGLVDEMFLLDDTQLGDQVDQIPQLIGMAIAMRMQNLTGIGKREQAVRPDLTALQEHDDGGLITNVGSVCPLEVVFPARDLAVGFARRRAQAILRDAIQESTLDYREEDLLRNQICPARKLMEAFRITDRERRAAPEPRRWGPSEVIQGIDRYSTVIEQAFAEQRQEALRDHIAALDALAQNPNWGRSLTRLKAAFLLFASEYKKVKDLTFASNPSMTRWGPDQLANENERKRKAYYQQACAEEFQMHRINSTNHVADLMIDELTKRVRMIDNMLAALRLMQQRWEADHVDSPEMSGMLTQQHPYRHNVFDHSAIADPNAINALDTAVTVAEAEKILKDAMVRMAMALSGDERDAKAIAQHEANAIMDNMVITYQQRLGEMRLLEAIGLVFPMDRGQQEQVLANHMRWMSVSARSTLRHDPSLWGDQAHRQLEVRAHLAVDYEDERERQTVERARQSVSGFGDRGPGYVPPGELMHTNDPERLQLLFSHHGVSLSAVPFLADAAGGCVKSLKDRQRIWETQGGIPVFTCDMLQDLVLRPGAFYDPLYDKQQKAGTVGGSAQDYAPMSAPGTTSPYAETTAGPHGPASSATPFYGMPPADPTMAGSGGMPPTPNDDFLVSGPAPYPTPPPAAQDFPGTTTPPPAPMGVAPTSMSTLPPSPPTGGPGMQVTPTLTQPRNLVDRVERRTRN